MKKWLIFIILIWVSFNVAAADFTPQGNINNRGLYNITNTPVVNATTFYGDGSALTGIGNNTDNSSWNQSFADTLYAGGSENSSWNQSFADSLYSTIDDNQSWNESKADGKYAQYDFLANNFNGSGNINTTGEINGVNQTMFDALISNFNSWITNSVSDLTNYYAKSVINSIVSGNITDSEASLRTDIESNRSYLEDLKLNYSALPLENQTIVNWANITNRPTGLDDGDDDTTYSAGSNLSLVGTTFSINATQIKTWLDTIYLSVSGFQSAFNSNFSAKTTDDLTQGSTNLYENASWNQSRATTLYAPSSTVTDNSSWNQTFATTLYAPIITVTDNASWNKSYADGLYISQSDEGTLNVNSSVWFTNKNETNSTQFNAGNSLTINMTWFSSVFDTLFGSKDTDDLSQGSANFYDNQSWNKSYADTLYGEAGNESWNQSFADSLYDPLGSGNASFNQSHTDTLYATIGAGSDNTSWNQTYATTLFISQSDEGTLNVNNSDFWDNYDEANTSQFNSAGVLTLSTAYINNLFDIFITGITTDEITQGANNLYENSSWNQSHADSIYSTVSGNASWNQSFASTIYDSDDTDEVLIDGSRALTGNWAVGGFNITNVGNSFFGAVAYPSNFIGNFKGGINVTENSYFEKNLTHLNNTYTCYGSSCESYIGYNGSGLVIKF